MPEEKRFSRISVHAEDDEVVIRAGAVVDPPRESAPEVASRPVDAVASEAVAAIEADSEGVPPSCELPSEDDEDDGRFAKARVGSDEQGYRETTLEDLEGGKAPFAQKAVIVAAILLIVCAIVYGVAFA